MKRLSVIVALVALSLGALAFANRASSSDLAASGTEQVVGLDLPLVYLDGETGNVSDYLGKPVVLNFWASWCPACVAELPDFAQVQNELGDEVVFIGINMQEVDRQAADELIAETGVNYRLVDDPNGEIFRGFGGLAMPTTVFVGADGVIVDTHAGTIFSDQLKAFIEDELLGS